MSTSLSPPNYYLGRTPITLTSTLKSASDAIRNPSSQSAVQAATENVVTSPGEHANKQARQEGTQDHLLSFYTEEEENKIKEDLFHHFEAHDEEGSRTTTGKPLTNQGKHPRPTPAYTWKIGEGRRRRGQSTTREEKKARVSHQTQSSWSPATCNKPPGFVLFHGQQLEFCARCLMVLGLMQVPNVRACPNCKRAFVCEQQRIPLRKLYIEMYLMILPIILYLAFWEVLS